MACGQTLTASRKKSGFAKPKGYRAISFVKWDGANIVQNTPTGVIALPSYMTTPPSIYRFEVKNTADNFIDTATKDTTTLTATKAGVGTFALMYCDRIANVSDAQALLDGIFVVFFEGNDGSFTVAGAENGADIVTVVESTDAQGFLFTMNTFERYFRYSLASTGITAYNSGIVAAV